MRDVLDLGWLPINERRDFLLTFIRSLVSMTPYGDPINLTMIFKKSNTRQLGSSNISRVVELLEKGDLSRYCI